MFLGILPYKTQTMTSWFQILKTKEGGKNLASLILSLLFNVNGHNNTQSKLKK